MIRSFLTVSTGTLASRLLGFARDSMIAALLGAGPVADAFWWRFNWSMSTKAVERGRAQPQPWCRRGCVCARPMAPVLPPRSQAASSAPSAQPASGGRIARLLMPLVVTALAPGFAGHETLQLAVNDARLIAALSRLRRAGDGDDGAVERTSALRADRVLAASVQHRADRCHDHSARLAAGCSFCCAGDRGHGRDRRLLQLLILVGRRRGDNTATPLRISFDAPMRDFLGKAIRA